MELWAVLLVFALGKSSSRGNRSSEQVLPPSMRESSGFVLYHVVADLGQSSQVLFWGKVKLFYKQLLWFIFLQLVCHIHLPVKFLDSRKTSN